MKRLIIIILVLIMMLFTAPNQGADQPHVAAEKPPQSAITIMVEQVPDEDEKTAETAFVGEVSGDKSVTEAPKEEASVFQETVTEECTEVSETIIIEMEEDTVGCLDEGDQSLAEYKPHLCFHEIS